MVQLSSGVRFGRFELLIELGRGGMASVWVAREFSRSSQKQRLVALKVMLPKLARDSTFRAMFLEEGGLARAIEHEHVVQIYEVAESHGLLYMAMEWVEGDSLRTLIEAARQRRPIPPEMAVRIIADTAAGLHAAHELRGWDGELRGVVHCDVSPHNILIGPEGIAKLVDFGVAHAASHLDGEEAEPPKGKFGYMSPEQALGQKVDRRSDVFALGVVLFELTTGERLFRGRDPTHTLKLVLRGTIPKPSELIADYPAALERIVMRALERDVDSRYETAEELRAALEGFLREQHVVVSHAGVGSLANRVLGDLIKARRRAIRAALKQLGQPSAATNLPASDPHNSVPPAPISVSPTSTTASGAGSSVLSVNYGLSVPQPRRVSWGYIAAASVILAAGAGAVFFILNDAYQREVQSATSHVATQPATPLAPEPEPSTATGEGDEAVDSDLRLEDLPPLDRHGRPLHAPGQRPPRKR